MSPRITHWPTIAVTILLAFALGFTDALAKSSGADCTETTLGTDTSTGGDGSECSAEVNVAPSGCKAVAKAEGDSLANSEAGDASTAIASAKSESDAQAQSLDHSEATAHAINTGTSGGRAA